MINVIETEARLNRMLMGLLGSEELVQRWWTIPNRAFDYQTPRQVFDTIPDRVAQYVLDQFSR
jgi:hypothetical protein